MPHSRLMVTGATGLLGSAILDALGEKWEVYPFGGSRLPLHERASLLDLRNRTAVDIALAEVRPDVVLHLAALADVDACQRNPNLAYQANVVCTRNITIAAASLVRPPKVIFISTDHVYDADGQNKVDDVRPSNTYALTKLWAEDIVLALLPDALVLRTNFVCVGNNERLGFGGWLLESLELGRPLRLFSDVYFNPVHASTLPDIINRFIEKRGQGIYNVGASDGGVSKADFARHVAQCAGFSADNATDCSVGQAGLLANRPTGMVMDVRETEALLEQKMQTRDGCVAALVDEWMTQRS